MKKTRIALLGSTGSIGTQTLDVIAEHSDLYQAEVLTANRNVDLLVEQARRFKPDSVVIADETKYKELRDALVDEPIKVYAGKKALDEVVTMGNVDTVLVALVGFSGLSPTISAIHAHKKIALANKETLVVAGELIISLLSEYHANIIPVDSEHSAILQCIVGEGSNTPDKILLTASGGPFRSYSSEQLSKVTVEEALHHPRWSMGAKITIDSATMMNKGFEVIEARWLFDVPPEKIQVLIHPQSIVHSAVQFADGAIKAQLGIPDMRIPIQYALSFPQRLPLKNTPLDLSKIGGLTFELPDEKKFPCLAMAYDALARGGNTPSIVNAANEVANMAFRDGKIKFTDISKIISRTLDLVTYESAITPEILVDTDREARAKATEMIHKPE